MSWGEWARAETPEPGARGSTTSALSVDRRRRHLSFAVRSTPVLATAARAPKRGAWGEGAACAHCRAVAVTYAAILSKYDRTGGAERPVARTVFALSNLSSPVRYGS